MAFLDSWPLAVVGLAVFAALLIAVEAGYRGYRWLRRGVDESAHSPDFLLSAALGLLSLLLGFTFSLDLARYDARRALVTQEANAIGTMWRRTQTLPEPYKGLYRDLIQHYAPVRLRWSEANEGLEATSALQQKLWGVTDQMAQVQSLQTPTLGVMQALGDAEDIQASRASARRARIPGHVVYSLFLYSLLSMVMLGYVLGVKGRRQYVASSMVLVLISLAWVLIADLDRPLGGVILVSQQPLIDLQAAMK
jgi:hypothetical protein